MIAIGKQGLRVHGDRREGGGRAPEDKWEGLEMTHILPTYFSCLSQVMWPWLTLREPRNELLCVSQNRKVPDIGAQDSLYYIVSLSRSVGVAGQAPGFHVVQCQGAVLTTREQTGQH